MPDWLSIKTEYINDPESSIRKLAEKCGVSYGALRWRAEREQWAAQKDVQQRRISVDTARKTAEKISDDESEIAAIKSRMRRRIYEEIERRMNEEMSTSDFRRLVQCYRDMCEISTDRDEDYDECGVVLIPAVGHE